MFQNSWVGQDHMDTHIGRDISAYYGRQEPTYKGGGLRNWVRNDRHAKVDRDGDLYSLVDEPHKLRQKNQ